jgi:hypothetical protein
MLFSLAPPDTFAIAGVNTRKSKGRGKIKTVLRRPSGKIKKTRKTRAENKRCGPLIPEVPVL